MIPSIALFIVLVIWIRPWGKKFEVNKWLIVLCIDALHFGLFYKINFWKIFILFRLFGIFKELWQKPPKVKIILLLVLVVPSLGAAHYLIQTTATLKLLDCLVILRKQFSLLTSFLIGYEFYKAIVRDGYEQFLKPVIVAGVVIVGSAFIEKFFVFDIFHFVSGGRALLIDRVRGLMIEPRALSYMTVAIIWACIFFRKKWVFWSLLPTLLVCFIWTKSTSGLVVGFIAALIGFIFLVYSKDWQKLAKLICAALMFPAFLFLADTKDKSLDFTAHAKHRLSIEVTSPGKNVLDSIAKRFEIYDAAYLNFLIQNPQYLIFGTGGPNQGEIEKYVYDHHRRIYGYNSAGGKEWATLTVLFLISLWGMGSLLFVYCVLKCLMVWTGPGKAYWNLLIILAMIQHFTPFYPFLFSALFLYLFENRTARTSSGLEPIKY
jgi:hypothetical protein